MKSGITRQTCVDYPLIKKSLPSHPQGVGATRWRVTGRKDPSENFGQLGTHCASFVCCWMVTERDGHHTNNQTHQVRFIHPH
jgi:hypothetical protein